MIQKYRVWDSNWKCWRGGEKDPSNTEFYIRCDGVICGSYQGKEPATAVAMPEHFKAVFSTGLKDKNGVEIHDGHIVKLQSHKNSGTAEVVWADYSWYVKGIKGAIRWQSFKEAIPWFTFEVIGHKYENPELLEAK